jgi:hypothetical protein
VSLDNTVSHGGGSWLVDHAHDFEASDLTSVFGRLSLGIVEISGHGNHTPLDILLDEVFSLALELLQDHRGNLLGVEGLCLSLELDTNHWLVVLTSLDLEWPQLDVLLHEWVAEFSSD